MPLAYTKSFFYKNIKFSIPIFQYLVGHLMNLGADYVIPLTRDQMKREMILRY